MSTFKEFELQDGEKCRLDYDAQGRTRRKVVYGSNKQVQESVEYRYSADDKLIEWKWYGADGQLLGAFIGERINGQIENVKQSQSLQWKFPAPSDPTQQP
ncbi:MAG: hypothetical protein PSV13_08100 [Lacunisphaera sp.]|nr:hypothetical protein [Lacunisphaera sp.]